MTRRLAVGLAFLLICGAAEADPGWGIVLDSKGNVFYTDLRHVWKVEPSGRKTIAVAHRHTHELYIDAADNLYGEHLWYEGGRDKWWHHVWRLSPDGKLTEEIPTTEGFRKDYSFVRDRTGAMYWIRARKVIIRRDRDGRVNDFAGGAAAAHDGKGKRAGFDEMGVLAYGEDGNFYTVDAADRLRRITPDGTVTTMARRLDERNFVSRRLVSSWHYIMGVAADREGNVYLAYLHDRKLRKVTREGKVSIMLENADHWAPCGVVTRNGEVYVLEFRGLGDVRVRKIAADGRITTLP
jgi:hypothetical protein